MSEQGTEQTIQPEISTGQEAQPNIESTAQEGDLPEVKRAKPRFNTTAADDAARLRGMAHDYTAAMGVEPTLESMDQDIEKYTSASIDRKQRALAAEILEKSATAKDNEAAQSMHSSWASLATEARKSYPDFDKVFNGEVVVTRTMAESILSADEPHEVAYYLGRNRSEAQRISALPAHLQGYQIAKIEASMVNRKRATNTPAPAEKHVSGVSGKTRNLSEVSFSDYRTQRDKERMAS